VPSESPAPDSPRASAASAEAMEYSNTTTTSLSTTEDSTVRVMGPLASTSLMTAIVAAGDVA
jgi:hypothetical protein